MNRRSVLVAAALLALPGVAATAGQSGNISFDGNTDFRALRTFMIRDGRIDSRKPEVDNRLFRQRVNDVIRARLTAKGLTEVAEGADLAVSFSFADADYSQVERMGPVRVPDLPGQRGFVVPGSGPRPVLFTEGTLVIDMFDASGALVWRGASRNREQNGPALSRKLSGDARRLVAKFPPKKR